jgi:hypothetical protein
MWIAIYKALESFLVLKLVLSYSPERKKEGKKGFTLLAVLPPQVRLSYHLRRMVAF